MTPNLIEQARNLGVLLRNHLLDYSQQSEWAPIVDQLAASLGPRVEGVGEPGYLDDLELRYIEACEERDHLRAALAQQARPQPLTDEQIESLLVNWPKNGIAFFEFARAIERAHGIHSRWEGEKA